MPLVTTLSGSTLLVDLETRDFEGFRSDILSTGGLADTYAPNWTDRSELDVGVALVESFAFMADNLSYYQDRMANEAFLMTAVQRRSVIEHCKLVGYELSPAVSAGVTCTIVTSTSGDIKKYSTLTNDTTNGQALTSFFLANDLHFDSAGTYVGVDSDDVPIVFYHATVVPNEVVGTSNGTANQSFDLAKNPLTNYSSGVWGLEVYVDAVLWTRVDNFLDSVYDDIHYRVTIDEYDVVTITFGDGINGSIPTSSATITATYLIGGGQLGNQVAVDKLVTISLAAGSTVGIVTSITNPAAPSGGQDRESINQAKIAAPKTFRSFNRAVTHEDYAALAANVPGVLYAYAYRGTGAYEEHVVIACSGVNPVPAGTWDPYTETGTDLLGAVGDYLTTRKTAPVILWVDPVRVVEVYLTIEAYLLPTARRADCIRLINDAVNFIFYSENQSLGRQIPISDIYAAVEAIYGVDYLNITRFQRIPNARKVPLGTATDATVGGFIVSALTQSDTYRLKFTSSSDFEVNGTSSGFQGTGTIDVQFTSADGTFQLTVTSGSTPPTAADKWDFTTGTYLANIDPDPDELLTLYGSSFQLTTVGGLG